MIKYKINIIVTVVSLFVLAAVLPGFSQTRSGVSFLKFSPGARQVGMAGTLTGALDHTYSFYANPGAAGLSREWQWSVTYTNWISDIYNATFLYGRNIPTPWSRRTRFILGVNYLGVPNFDSSEGASPFVSGNDVLVSASIGQPLTKNETLSIGTNLKYFRSELAQFSGDTFIADFGITARTPRLALFSSGSKLFEYAILSAGVAVTNLGNSITFVSESTPLPRTLRAGAALNLGSHNGLQLSFGTDYRKVRDEDGFVTIGSEVSWRQLLALRWGYSFEDNLLGEFSFGASLQLDDLALGENSFIPGRNNAVRVDLAANQNSDFTSSPFHGSMTHIPIGPEQFTINEPLPNVRIDADSVTLGWESSRDPDLYDDVTYWLLVDQDSLKLSEVIAISERSNASVFHHLSSNGRFLYQLQLSATRHTIAVPVSGDYFWSVFAYDNDGHIRFAKLADRMIAKFTVTAPDLRITDIQFDYSPWITTDDYQGILKFVITNQGQRIAQNFLLAVIDSTDMLLTRKVNGGALDGAMSNPHEIAIPEIPPGGSTTVEMDWHSNISGLHYIEGKIYPAGASNGRLNSGESRTASFFTIPKGTFATFDTVLTQAINNLNYELPYVGKIFFDSSSVDIKPGFIREWVIEPQLITLAERLRDNAALSIILHGTADPTSGETDAALATDRAKSVRDALLSLGVSTEQIEIVPGTYLPPRNLPKDPQDGLWILQERRRVDVVVAEPDQEKVFRPLEAYYRERTISPVTFSADISGAVSLQNGFVEMKTDQLLESFDIQHTFSNSDIRQNLTWQYQETSINRETDWQNADVDYALVLVDSLDRRFQTHPKLVHLKTKSINRERMYFGVAKFAQVEPLYSFYWDNLLERVPTLLDNPTNRLRFIGHACAIGPEAVNLRLSEQRALAFHRKFLADAKAKYPDMYSVIEQRIDPPEGFGETKPFTFKGAKGELLLLGDNATPTGRQLNRRVMALIYSTE